MTDYTKKITQQVNVRYKSSVRGNKGHYWYTSLHEEQSSETCQRCHGDDTQSVDQGIEFKIGVVSNICTWNCHVCHVANCLCCILKMEHNITTKYLFFVPGVKPHKLWKLEYHKTIGSNLISDTWIQNFNLKTRSSLKTRSNSIVPCKSI